MPQIVRHVMTYFALLFREGAVALLAFGVVPHGREMRVVRRHRQHRSIRIRLCKRERVRKVGLFPS